MCRCSGVRVVCDQGNAETSEVGSLGGFPGVLFVRSFITPVTITLLSCHYTPLCHYTPPIRHYTPPQHSPPVSHYTPLAITPLLIAITLPFCYYTRLFRV